MGDPKGDPELYLQFDLVWFIPLRVITTYFDTLKMCRLSAAQQSQGSTQSGVLYDSRNLSVPVHTSRHWRNYISFLYSLKFSDIGNNINLSCL